MNPPKRNSKSANIQRLLLTSTSAAAMLISAQAQAQQIIANGTTATTVSQADGETISNPVGNAAVVADNPAIEIANNDVTVQNDGSLATTGVTQTIQVNADTSGAILNNGAAGTLTADSRVINVDGDNVVINNDGSLLGTGSQRNGAIYGNRTSDNLTINNNGSIDAGNEGAAIAIEVGGGGGPISGTIVNSGTINGRGQAAATGGTAGDGIRFFGPGLVPKYIYAGDITNNGTINSDSTQGTVAGIRFANRIGFQGTLTNDGTISGVQNGLYFGNDADNSGGIVNNSGIISSGSRALNIDGLGLVVNNLADGQIIGTGDQRNGTVYADSTAQDFTLNNAGLIDAGEDNQGAGFSVELSEDGNNFDINNSGTIQGRGIAGAGSPLAGDGLRFERERVNGLLDGTTSGLFTGTITNSGLIDSEGNSGTTAGIRFVNGVSFNGTIDNIGTISGVQNGLYFGNATPAGGGDFTGAIVNNSGIISSGSRALNIDGLGLVVNNLADGQIIGTGDQRNGTVYADGTANNFTLNNTGNIDAVVQGSGVSFQLGVNDGDVRSFTLVNDGTIAGRGEALASGESAGLRLFNGAGAGTTVTVTQDIVNNGTISSETGPALLIENIAFTGSVINNGTLTGPIAVDASTALAAVDFVQNDGSLNGTFIGSAFTDTLNFTGTSTLAGDVNGNVDVTVNEAAIVTVDGERAIDGNLTSNGILNFDLNVDSLAVDGDTILGANSIVNVATTQITQADIGTAINVITETGSFTNNGVTVNILDDDFLIDYNVALSSIIVTPSAADLSTVSADANISSFGTAITGAVANNRLQGDVFTALNNLTTAADFEAASISLLPAINDGVAREIFETQRFASALLTDRLAGDSSGIWGQVFFRTSDRDAESLSSVGYDGNATGFTLGADAKVGAKGKIGAFFSYADIDVDSDGAAQAQSSINSYQFSAYAGINSETAFVNAELGYSINDIESSRNSITGPVSGDTDADSFIASVNGGLNLGNDKIAFTPFAGLRYATISQDAFTETGGLGLTLDTDTTDFLEASIGLGISGKAKEDKDLSVVPFLRLAYTYDLIGDGVGINGSFNAGADSFRLTSDSASDSRFDVGAGLNLVNNNGFSIAAEYQGRFASDYQSHTGGVTVRFAF